MQLLKMTGITKRFAGITALEDVEFSVNKGEVHVLAGENGAGKSTILKILAGIHKPDEGKVFWKDSEVYFKNPHDSQDAGIAMVFQELTLVREMTVAENLYLSKEPTNKLGLINKKEIIRQLNEAMDTYGIHVDPYSVVGTLPIAQQQMIEILKVLMRNPELIILDEPTSALAKKEVEQLYVIIKKLISLGKTIIFISHRLEEVFTIGDRVTVFKDGKFIAAKNIKEIDENALIQLMVGRELENIFPPKAEDIKEKELFRAENLSSADKKVNDVSFSVREGEILGIAGLQGHGQSELLNAVSGLLPLERGAVYINSRAVSVKSSSAAVKNGIALVPADRKTQGLMLELSIRHNLAVSSMGKRKKAIFIDAKKERAFAGDMINKLSIKTKQMENPVNSLSGGNQQKVVLGKELAIGPSVILFDDPTRGIDVEAKREFYIIMRNLAKEGVAVVMNSTDLMEVIGMSDRVLVMYEGRISAVLENGDINEETIMKHAMGLEGGVQNED